MKVTQGSTAGIDQGQVLTYSPATNTASFLGYTERTVHTEHDNMYLIETSLGHSIKVTDDHSLATNSISSYDEPTDSLFKPVPPQEALGCFVPIIKNVSYSVSPTADKEAIKEFFADKQIEEGFTIQPYMLNLCDLYLQAILDDFGNFRPELTNSYVYKDDYELQLALLIFARGGYACRIDRINMIVSTLTTVETLVPEGDLLIASVHVDDTNVYKHLPYAWDIVTKVTKIPREDVTYDFTVPEFPLFIGNSILVYDTMQVHVPISEGARIEANEKMLPSANLFNPRTMEPMMIPQQESVFGLYEASKPLKSKPIIVTNLVDIKAKITKGTMKPNHPVVYQGITTTAGLVLVNDLLPKDLRVYDKEWNKSIVSKALTVVAKRTPKDYAHIADGIKELGALFVYKAGSSFQAEDFDVDSLKKERDKEFAKIETEMRSIDKSKLSKTDKYNKTVDVLMKAQQISQKLTDKATGNTFQQWAYTGARGNKGGSMQIISSPVVVSDPKDRVIPVLIRKSYNEGLSPSDYWVSSYGTRKGTVGAKLSVAPAGALAKEVIGNTLDIVITTKDCKTKEGVMYPTSDTKNILERFEAGTNNLIDANYLEKLKDQNKLSVMVRTPTKCHARDGVCQMCYGYNDKGKLPNIGDNVGVLSAHSTSEPLSQMGLSSKHTAGTASTTAVGLNTIKSFFNMSNQFVGAALISEVNGTISRVEAAPAGGTNIWVGKKKYHVPPTRKLQVKMGDTVHAGDILTDGVPNIGKIVNHKGIDFGRQAFVEHASDLYNKAGVPVLKKNFETIARGLINYVQITNPGDFPDLIEGDVVDYNQLRVDIQKAPVALKRPTFVPYQKGTNKAPTYKKDWLSNFGFKYIKGELIDNAATGAKSDIHSYHPIAGYAAGYEFGQGENGKY